MGGVFFIMLSVNKTILILPGDGIGPEIVHEAQKIANILNTFDDLPVFQEKREKIL